ncbi:FMN-binding negative transcriptional regulator [Afipia sp. GAS231]|uniref:FMN-binding negative transcriptional regulator n=1 Tax=Afipia sp. GAS231 TaxID=1882747 RepID=UPI00087C39B2|nr:FMN-binding negative transcriptional regulator [Afipia sp. GAS231]SDP04331.1 negative transcriptional regulator, PaiB family [Afipia sp. GAS231]
MHILRPNFDWDRDDALDFAAARGFGAVIASGASGPISSHVPFRIVRTGEKATVQFHLTARNKLAELADGDNPFLLIVWGPDAYVSNDWYATPDHVSTWLYEAVHLTGPVRRLAVENNRSHGDALLATFEARLTPKQPWSLSTMEDTKREAMLQGIVVLEMDVQRIEGQRKLNQHKSDEDYASITRHLEKAESADAREIAGKLKALRPHLKY